MSTDSVEIIGFNASNPAWTAVCSMEFKRRNVNAVLLPTGRVLVCSGIKGFKSDSDPQPVFAAEEYDPDSDSWSTFTEMTVPRLYHSVSLLLPDARVVTLGSAMANGTFTLNKKVEVFGSPYLCRGPRPTITAVLPQEVQYGNPFSIVTPDATSIVEGGEVVLVRPGAATHHTDSEQRVVPLVVTQDSKAGGLRATAPNATVAPPGYYMLFLINEKGVPSIFLNEAGEPSPGDFIRLSHLQNYRIALIFRFCGLFPQHPQSLFSIICLQQQPNKGCGRCLLTRHYQVTGGAFKANFSHGLKKSLGHWARGTNNW